MIAKATARSRCPETPRTVTGRRTDAGRRDQSRSSAKSRVMPDHTVAPATTSTTRATTPTRIRPAGSASSPAVASWDPPWLEPDDPVSSRRAPITARPSTARALAPDAIRFRTRCQPDADRNPVAAAVPCQMPKATRPRTTTTIMAMP